MQDSVGFRDWSDAIPSHVDETLQLRQLCWPRNLFSDTVPLQILRGRIMVHTDSICTIEGRARTIISVRRTQCIHD